MKISNWCKISIVTLIIQLFVYRFLLKQSVWIEDFYVPHIFYPLSEFLRKLSGYFNFSLGLVILYGLLVLIISWMFRQIWQKSLRSQFTLILSLISPLLFLYMILWGFLYNRQSIADLQNLDTSPVKISELANLCRDLVQDTNQSRSRLTDDEIYKATTAAIFSQAQVAFNSTGLNYYQYKTPSIKEATGSYLLAYMGVGGIYSFWSGEANVNKLHTQVSLPEVTLHEMAHQLGFASEDEANYAAWWVGKNSGNTLFEYSANYSVVWRSLSRLWQIDSTLANSLYAQIDSSVYRDAEISNARWKPYRNPLEKYVFSPIYNIFLKANGQEYGILSYDRVVDLIIYERRNKRY